MYESYCVIVIKTVHLSQSAVLHSLVTNKRTHSTFLCSLFNQAMELIFTFFENLHNCQTSIRKIGFHPTKLRFCRSLKRTVR